MQTVHSTGKILLTFRSHDLSHERTGNSGGEQVEFDCSTSQVRARVKFESTFVLHFFQKYRLTVL